jgi:hypothetical protein
MIMKQSGDAQTCSFSCSCLSPWWTDGGGEQTCHVVGSGNADNKQAALCWADFGTTHNVLLMVLGHDRFWRGSQAEYQLRCAHRVDARKHSIIVSAVAGRSRV